MIYLAIILMFLIDWYVFQPVKVITKSWKVKKIVWGLYWLIAFAAILSLLQWKIFGSQFMSMRIQRYIGLVIIIEYVSELFAVLFLIFDGYQRLIGIGLFMN